MIPQTTQAPGSPKTGPILVAYILELLGLYG